MITWQDVEEKAELAKDEVASMAVNSIYLFDEETFEDGERSALRRFVAAKFINMGMRIDPLAISDRESVA